MRLKRTPDEAAAKRAEPKSLDELNAQIASAAPLVPGATRAVLGEARLGRPLRS
jgi:DNA polymerase